MVLRFGRHPGSFGGVMGISAVLLLAQVETKDLPNSPGMPPHAVTSNQVFYIAKCRRHLQRNFLSGTPHSTDFVFNERRRLPRRILK